MPVFGFSNVQHNALTIQGARHIGWYQSSEPVLREFSSVCRLTLFGKPAIEGYELTAVATSLCNPGTKTYLA